MTIEGEIPSLARQKSLTKLKSRGKSFQFSITGQVFYRWEIVGKGSILTDYHLAKANLNYGRVFSRKEFSIHLVMKIKKAVRNRTALTIKTFIMFTLKILVGFNSTLESIQVHHLVPCCNEVI